MDPEKRNALETESRIATGFDDTRASGMKLGTQQHVGHSLPLGRHAVCFQHRLQLASRQAPTFHGARDEVDRLRPGASVELELPVPKRVLGIHDGSAQRHQPPQVFRRDVVPRRAQHVRPEDGALGVALFDLGVCAPARSLRHRPLRVLELLGLDGDEPSNNVFGCVEIPHLAREHLG